MSSLYDIEPQPTAKLILQTTAGEILLELFGKQTPLTCRNFLQLCLDGYYDNTIFHRLVPGFVVQGGDPTGTGEGGEAIYDGGLFVDEFHSRLKFNRRGLLGMANTGQKNDNGSQFFLTLGKTEELNGRNTMFGRVAGDTIYNLMKMGEGEVMDDGSERPIFPTKITGTDILVNPFEDMVRREMTVKPVIQEKKEGKKKPAKKKGGKALLSFGGDEGDEPDASPVTKKAKFNPKLFDAEQMLKSPLENDTSSRTPSSKKPSEKPLSTRQPSPLPVPSQSPSPAPAQILPSRSSNQKSQRQTLSSSSSSSSSSPEPEPPTSKISLSRTNAEIASLKASMRRPNLADAAASSLSAPKKSALEQLIPATSVRGRKRKKGRETASDREALEMLNAFRAKLENIGPATSQRQISAPRETEKNGIDTTAPNNATTHKSNLDQQQQPQQPDQEGNEDEATLCDLHFIANCQSCRSWDAEDLNRDRGTTATTPNTSNTSNKNKHNKPWNENNDNDIEDDGGNDDSWLAHTLSFEKDRLGKDLTWKRKNEELVVIDPREKGKEIRDEKRRGREKERGRGRGRGTGTGGAW
ncbi:MAG: Peptidyl-prolyl isomerase cwc27 [Sclerophora amabilis]|nr:MAG: Peptidyl-prolyl isomerase cwc27 [Sclerophora amabilis]